MPLLHLNSIIPTPIQDLALDQLITLVHVANPGLAERVEITQPATNTWLVSFRLVHLFKEFGVPQGAGEFRVLKKEEPVTEGSAVYEVEPQEEGVLSAIKHLRVTIRDAEPYDTEVDCGVQTDEGTPELVTTMLERIFQQALQRTGTLIASVAADKDVNTAQAPSQCPTAPPPAAETSQPSV